jgi:large subunit ribosomal protein L24e
MVIKTDPCSFTEYRIYPGRGRRFAAKDGKVHYFITTKAASLFHQRKKAVKLTWTQAWRRFNKKIKVDEITKRRTRKTTRVQKAIVGISLDEIKRRRAEKPEERDKKMEQAKKEVKDRQKK